MDIKLKNTLTREVETFKPLRPGEVSMYNCGPTVYDYAHIGNLRSYIFADTLRRMFEYNGYKVNQVINITDIGHLSSDGDSGEDKMTKALKRESKPMTLEAMREVADFYFNAFKEDLLDLNIELPEHFPFASDHIKEDIDLVSKLIENGYTYITSDGIYFDTEKFPEYGKLGNINGTDEDHSRIGLNSEKKNAKDFAIWKFNKDLGYEAPFGKGFPGWHIECSAMSVKYLGPEFDIHTGGIDHIPVHHNNEIAQSVCAGYSYARVWMHNAFLTMGEDKMAKSLGNYITLNTLREKKIDPLAYRYLLLSAKYDSPLQFSWEALEGSSTALKRLREKISAIDVEEEYTDLFEKNKSSIHEHINNDLDTPKIVALIWDILKEEYMTAGEKKAIFKEADRILGLGFFIKESFKIPEDVMNLVEERNEARKNKDFEKSDEIRAKIEELGYEVKDMANTTEVRPK